MERLGLYSFGQYTLGVAGGMYLAGGLHLDSLWGTVPLVIGLGAIILYTHLTKD